MAITVNLYYTGTNGSARKFAQEMTESGTVERIKKKKEILNMIILCRWMIQRRFCLLTVGVLRRLLIYITPLQ